MQLPSAVWQQAPLPNELTGTMNKALSSRKRTAIFTGSMVSSLVELVAEPAMASQSKRQRPSRNAEIPPPSLLHTPTPRPPLESAPPSTEDREIAGLLPPVGLLRPKGREHEEQGQPEDVLGKADAQGQVRDQVEEGEPQPPGPVERGAGDHPEGEELEIDRRDPRQPTDPGVRDQPRPENARRVVLDHLRGDLVGEALRVEIGDEFTADPLLDDPSGLPGSRHAVGQQEEGLRAREDQQGRRADRAIGRAADVPAGGQEDQHEGEEHAEVVAVVDRSERELERDVLEERNEDHDASPAVSRERHGEQPAEEMEPEDRGDPRPGAGEAQPEDRPTWRQVARVQVALPGEELSCREEEQHRVIGRDQGLGGGEALARQEEGGAVVCRVRRAEERRERLDTASLPHRDSPLVNSPRLRSSKFAPVRHFSIGS